MRLSNRRSCAAALTAFVLERRKSRAKLVRRK
jgi:hypothetical protein